MEKQNQTQKTLSIYLSGQYGVGKTLLLLPEQDDTYFKKRTINDSLINAFTKIKTTSNNNEIIINIFDYRPPGCFGNHLPMYLGKADIILFVYDITNHHSFEDINTIFLKQTNKVLQKSQTNPKKVLVGNKIDFKEERAVSIQEAIDFANDHQMEYFEISAKTRKNVKEMFDEIIKERTEKLKPNKKIIFLSSIEKEQGNGCLS